MREEEVSYVEFGSTTFGFNKLLVLVFISAPTGTQNKPCNE